MKILFCSPYGEGTNSVIGGISIWGKNILSYANSQQTDIELTPISFDRQSYNGSHTNVIERLYFGIKELSKAIRKAKNALDKCQYDIIHICSSASYSLLKDLALIHEAHKHHTKAVVHFHFGRIPELSQKDNWEWKLLIKVITDADCIITMDMQSYNVLRKLGFSNITYCPNPISDETLVQIRSLQNTVNRNQRRIVFVGHVLPSKGIYELIDACKNIDNIEVHLIGRSEPNVNKEIRKRVAEYKNSTWLHIRGEMPYENVLEEMLSAKLFVLPTYTEGFPNVILEAMACSCVIITTPVGAIPEMLAIESSDPCGCIVPVKNSEALQREIEDLLSNNDKAQKLADNAHKRLENNYTMDKVWSCLTQIWINIHN